MSRKTSKQGRRWATRFQEEMSASPHTIRTGTLKGTEQQEHMDTQSKQMTCVNTAAVADLSQVLTMWG